MYVYDRDGNYKGRAGKPVRDVRTGDYQKMGDPPKRGCWLFSALLGSLLLATGGVLAQVADWV